MHAPPGFRSLRQICFLNSTCGALGSRGLHCPKLGVSWGDHGEPGNMGIIANLTQLCKMTMFNGLNDLQVG